MPSNLSAYTSLQTPAYAQTLFFLKQQTQLSELAATLAKSSGKTPFIVLGCGSNVLFSSDYKGTVILNRLKGLALIDEDDASATITIAAGEVWHDCVLSLSTQGYHGLENLALIPGTVGAAPVQNIGAYGVEIASFIKSVSVFDLIQQKMIDMAAKDCGFAYRDSHFKKTDWQQRYVITAVTLKLKKRLLPVLTYQGLAQQPSPQTAAELIERIVSIRQNKLPSPEQLPNAGSFFKNPIIKTNALQALQKDHPDIPFYAAAHDAVKIPAAWLIERTGFKGVTYPSGAGVYEKHALVIVNHHQASGSKIYQLACDIMASVKQQFNISLTPEVRIIGHL